LTCIAIALERYNFPYVRLDGSMNAKKRGEAVSRFNEDPSIKVFLISIKAGGFGLNLTAANHVYLMEPNFNPQTESQAIDRVDRIGQFRDVMVKRLVMQDTVEQRIRVIAERKAKLAKLLLDKSGNPGELEKEQQKIMMEEILDMFKEDKKKKENDKKMENGKIRKEH
jgi:SNF2 family DNA or RNA helicase